ncbi:GNAT family N-acetyltransferase [Halosimplex pelagicum]|uniref:GNAT family N-acetyltransferase n=1 Tax=Halosimplex pelagicum TaxID=869886 RepID=A0A7D5T3S9_9EURY|nr:GNAT family N-acetyltransferase [Halosimplex pelagicum]QLH82131.1 GNAT family N-acetyltransferase [Halosimplex pelagicum]
MSTDSNTPNANSSIRLGSEFTIFHGDTPIGYIEPFGDRNHIIGHIEIMEEYRGSGYGKAATEAFVQRAKANGAVSVETSVVISPAFEHIARELGFTETAHEEDGLYLSKSL